MTFAPALFWLLVGHALMDYPLQGPFVSKAKNRHTPAFDVPPGQRAQTIWPYVLTAHAMLHGGAVALITGSVWLGVAEAVAHWIIDFGKCENWYGIHTDQWLHIGCKVLWAIAVAAS